jgi:hypothetical protein
MEFIVSPLGGFYVYSGSNLMFNFSDNTYDERYCPDRPIFDNNERIHVLKELSTGNFVYIVSDDTLNSLNYIDTLSNFPELHMLVANPDHSTVGAVFFDSQNNRIYKFLSAGGYINFSDSIYFNAPVSYMKLFDATLDAQDKIIAVIGIGDFNYNIYVWTEEFGLSYLEFAPDPVLEPIFYQLSLGAAYNEVIVAGYGSSIRTFDDTLHFVYSTDIWGDADTWHYPIPVDSITANLTSINEEAKIPHNISLFCAYPNPFNARTTIEFALAEPGDAELTIYDITGAKVETIRQVGLEAGRHWVVWDAADVGSGVYFARMEGGGKSESIKMVLLK